MFLVAGDTGGLMTGAFKLWLWKEIGVCEFVQECAVKCIAMRKIP